MIECGLDVEAQHHEVATAGQSEIDLRMRAGEDGRQTCAVQVHHQKRRQEVQQDRHVHAQAAVLGQRLRHAHAHLAVEGRQAAVRRQRLRRPQRDGPVRHRRLAEARAGHPGLRLPTTNSYKPLVPGYEAPVNLAYSQRNRSASCRIPMYSPSPKAKRVEFRCPDPSCNPTWRRRDDDGRARWHPEQDPSGRAARKDIYDLAPEELAEARRRRARWASRCRRSPRTTSSFRGDVFTEDVINTWIGYKQKNEVDAMGLRPHPYEFACTMTTEPCRLAQFVGTRIRGQDPDCGRQRASLQRIATEALACLTPGARNRGRGTRLSPDRNRWKVPWMLGPQLPSQPLGSSASSVIEHHNARALLFRIGGDTMLPLE